VCFDINPVLVLLFLIVFIPLEGLYLSSTVVKIPEGGWCVTRACGAAGHPRAL
jgi:K+ transporter